MYVEEEISCSVRGLFNFLPSSSYTANIDCYFQSWTWQRVLYSETGWLLEKIHSYSLSTVSINTDNVGISLYDWFHFKDCRSFMQKKETKDKSTVVNVPKTIVYTYRYRDDCFSNNRNSTSLFKCTTLRNIRFSDLTNDGLCAKIAGKTESEIQNHEASCLTLRNETVNTFLHNNQSSCPLHMIAEAYQEAFAKIEIQFPVVKFLINSHDHFSSLHT